MITITNEDTILTEIDQIKLSDRLGRWKEASLDATPKICTERATLAMQAYQDSDGEDIQIRRARLFARILENIPVTIQDWQLLAGSETEHLYGVHPDVDLSADFVLNIMGQDDVSVGSPVVSGAISNVQREELIKCAKFFQGQTVSEHVTEAWESAIGMPYMDYVTVVQPLGIPGPYLRAPISFDVLLSKGIRGIIEEAKGHIESLNQMQESEVERLHFWQSTIIVCEALIEYARRHAELAHDMARREQDPQRRIELEKMADVCEWVPENPARNLHEAIQAVTFILLGVKLETPFMPGDVGRIDQYLWPYFKKDLGEGVLTLEQAAELLASFAVFRGSVVAVKDMAYQQAQQNVAELNHITLGGVDRDGNDACNLLTYLILHIAGILAIPEPHYSLRWHPDVPSWIMCKSLETTAKVGGTPQFVNDAHVEQFWTDRGVPLEDVRDWSGLGCLPPIPPERTYYLVSVANQTKVLELTLNSGIDPMSGKQIGPNTGDPSTFATFEDLLGAFEKQYEFWAERMTQLGHLSEAVEPQYIRLPFLSSIAGGCMDRGKDIIFRDSPNFFAFCDDRAVIDNADCMVAIKKLVYDDKSLAMDELAEALKSNFAGDAGEGIRQMCLTAPKYGNDIDEVDNLAKYLGGLGGGIISSHTTSNGKPFNVERPGVSWHFPAGWMTGALPNGRKGGEPLNDGSLSPMRGQDRLGPTAVLRSVLKAGPMESLYNVLNQRFSLTGVQSPESMDKLRLLTETYLKNGGTHIQFNMVDTETLRDAQIHPELHKDLVVRVGGFNAYFVQLTVEVQDDVIARTQQGL